MAKSINIVRIPVEGAVEFIETPTDTLAEDIHEFVAGYFQCIPLRDGVYLWVNDDGKLIGLDPNPTAQRLWDAVYGAGSDYVVGNAILTGGADRHGNTLGLNADATAYLQGFFTGVARG